MWQQFQIWRRHPNHLWSLKSGKLISDFKSCDPPYSICTESRRMSHTFFINHLTIQQLQSQLTIANQRLQYLSTLLGQILPYQHYPEYQQLLPNILQQEALWKDYKTALVNRIQQLV